MLAGRGTVPAAASESQGTVDLTAGEPAPRRGRGDHQLGHHLDLVELVGVLQVQIERVRAAAAASGLWHVSMIEVDSSSPHDYKGLSSACSDGHLGAFAPFASSVPIMGTWIRVWATERDRGAHVRGADLLARRIGNSSVVGVAAGA